MSETSTARDPHLCEALVSLSSLVIGITLSIAVYGMDPQIPMLLGVLVASCAMMFGGVMEHTGQMSALVHAILRRVESSRSLISSTVLTAIGSNMILCDQYMTLVMTGRMYSDAYREHGLHAKNLSRVAEDAGTVTANLIPWNSGGAYQAATLGVPTFVYAPFAFFNWLSPLVTLMFGWFGWTIAPLDDEKDSESGVNEGEAGRGRM